MTLRLASLTLVDSATGEKIEVTVPEPHQLEFVKPFSDNVASANFISGAIMVGINESTKKIQPK